MTIRSLTARPFDLPLERPIETAAGVMNTSPIVLVDVVTDDGVTGHAYVRCYTPDGDLLGKIHIPETVANLCFGGQQRNRLYICGSSSLYAVYTSAQGAMKP